MVYWGGYRQRRYWGAYHKSKRAQLTNLFGGIDKDIEKAFFSLPSYILDAIFIEYGRRYNKSAESYARRTYPKWKSGTVKLSGQTAERLLQLLPPRLSKEKRYELIAKLRLYYLRLSAERRYIETPPEQWRQEVIPEINSLVNKSVNLKLPENVIKKATWLANGDSKAVQKILRSIELEEARQRASYLEAEFRRIEQFINNVKHTDSASHVISLPQGEIIVRIKKEKPKLINRMFGLQGAKMGKNDLDLIPREELQKALEVQQKRGNLLNLAFNDLSESQKLELKKKILEERINLDVSSAKADQRFYDSSRDMANTIQTVRNLEQSSKSDYEVRSTYKTASGDTTINIKKNKNTVIIVVAVVIGVILFLMLTK